MPLIVTAVSADRFDVADSGPDGDLADPGRPIGYIVRMFQMPGGDLAIDVKTGRKAEWIVSPIKGGLDRAMKEGKHVAETQEDALRYLMELDR